MKKITSFTELTVWQKSHVLALKIYRTTKKFPRDEQFGLTSQIRRAAVSIVSNIAEGFGRRTPNDKCQFYYTAKGSNSELQAQLLLSRDLGYIPNVIFQKYAKISISIHKMLNSLIKSVQTNKDKNPKY